MTNSSVIIIYIVAIYLLFAAVRDFRRGELLWGSFTAVAAFALIFLPIPTHAVNADMPETVK